MKKQLLGTLLIAGFLLLNMDSHSQNHAAAFAAADTSRFSVNGADNWLLFNSYVSEYKKDSVQIELIIQHNNNIDWNKNQLIGKIKYNVLLPSVAQTIPFFLLSNEYKLTIEPSGKCYLRYISGSIPKSNPVIIPIKVFYKL